MNFNAHHLAFNLDTIVELIRRGWTERLMLSHDAVICYNHTRWADWDHSQYINYAPDSLRYLKCTVVPMLLERGVTPDQIHTIFVKTRSASFSFYCIELSIGTPCLFSLYGCRNLLHIL